jgi:hypothetical protein
MKMFGFLFKKNKNPESKGQSRKSSKDLCSSNENVNNGSSSPFVPLTFQHSLNSVSLSTDSLSQSTSDSGKESGVSFDKSSSIASLNPSTFQPSSASRIQSVVNLAEVDNIQFIDEILPEDTEEIFNRSPRIRENEDAAKHTKWEQFFSHVSFIASLY